MNLIPALKSFVFTVACPLFLLLGHSIEVPNSPPENRPVQKIAARYTTFVMKDVATDDRINGPEGKKSDPGELVVLSINAADNAIIDWKVLPAKTLLIADGGRQVGFATSKPGVYYFVCAVVEGDKLHHEVYDLTIGVAPVNPPGPGPIVVPLTGLAGKVQAWKNSANDPATAVKIKEVFETEAAKIAAGAYASVEAAMNGTNERNQVAMGVNKPKWKTFFETLGAELDATQPDGNEPAILEWMRQQYLAIAEGLK